VQKTSHGFTDGERRVVRKWRVAVVGFYGSLLAAIALFAAVSDRSVQIARTDPPAEAQK
jgi:hypothetical protein